MKSIQRIQDDGRGAGAGECSCDLFTDVARLADAENDDLVSLGDGITQQVHSQGEPIIQAVGEALKLTDFD